MDTRQTISERETFLPVIKDLFAQYAKVNILYDNNGLTRYEGRILNIKDEKPQMYLLLEGGLEIALSSIIAVNGIFAPDYSEC